MDNILMKFESYAQESINNFNVPGMAIAIVKDEKLIYAKGFGVKKIGSNNKVDENTVFQIGSITKTFTTALLARLVDQKKLSWDDRVIDILPDFRMYDPWVTREFRVEDLLCHRSGLSERVGTLQAFLGYTRNDMIHNLRYIKPISSFRSKPAYQNILPLVAAAVAEKLTGKSWEQLISQKLFQPLGMTNSSVTLENYLSCKNVAALHELENKKFKAISRNWTHLNTPYSIGPSGGINSNIIDMSKWLLLQTNDGKINKKNIISVENMRFIQRPRMFFANSFGNDEYMSLGWIWRQYSPYPIVWHDGGTPGARSFVGFISQDRLGIVILTNAVGMIRHALACRFFDMYYDKPEKDWSKLLLQEQKNILKKTAVSKKTKKATCTTMSPKLQEYTGIYYSPMYGSVTLFVKKRKLVLVIGPKQEEMILECFNRNTFELIWPDMEILIVQTKVFFNFNDMNKAQEIIIELLDKDAGGCFVRVKEQDEG